MYCPPETATFNDCDSGFEFKTQMEELGVSAQQTTAVRTPVPFTDFLDNSFQVDTNACGELVVCMEPGVTRALELVGQAQYSPTLLADLELSFNVNQDQFVLIPSAFLTYAASQLMGYDPTLASMLITAEEVMVDGGQGCVLDGWQFVVVDLDGGILDAGYTYPQGTDFSGQTSTQGKGIEFAYNLDPGVGQVRLIANYTGDGGPAADGGCPFHGAYRGLTGVAHLVGGATTFMPYTLP
jgi:hypothetical protein